MKILKNIKKENPLCIIYFGPNPEENKIFIMLLSKMKISLILLKLNHKKE